jgi:transposase
VAHHNEAFVGLDTSKLRNAVAIAEAGRMGEIRFLGEFSNTPKEGDAKTRSQARSAI